MKHVPHGWHGVVNMARSRADIEADVPCLAGKEWSQTSCRDIKYNCFAWAMRETMGWMDPDESPGNYWHDDVPRERRIENYLEVYRRFGFEECEHGFSDSGYEVIAVFKDAGGDGFHAARRLPSGVWTSKLGKLEDIEHPALADLEGPEATAYGAVACFMRRRIA